MRTILLSVFLLLSTSSFAQVAEPEVKYAPWTLTHKGQFISVDMPMLEITKTLKVKSKE